MSADTIKNIYNQVKELGASHGHFEIHKPFQDQQATAVISVYVDEKPAHIVLEELYEWAEKSGNKELMEKIEELSSDLSFLNDK